MDFSLKYRQLSEDERIKITKETITGLDGLNNVGNSFIADYLSTAEGRQELLQKVVNIKLETPNSSLQEIINLLDT